ncbi:hypothetical protein HY413_02855 [Candidatus Kaiserbacteria bacterium]|nr:hypothetical protein [Candidatus Kaiserbacteria bacterium]
MRKVLCILIALAFMGIAPAVAGDVPIQNLGPGDGLPQELLDALKGLNANQQPVVVRGVVVPSKLFRTIEDQRAWNRLGEIFANYAMFFHRNLTGTEMASRFEKALVALGPLKQVPLILKSRMPTRGPMSGFIVPDDVFAAKDDQEAWSRVTKLLYEYAYYATNEWTGEEVAGQFITEGLTSLTPHDQAFTPKEARQFESMFIGFGGIGMEIKKSEDPALPGIAGSPIPDSPSAKAGVQTGDVVVEICAKPVKEDAQTGTAKVDEAAPETCRSTANMPLENAVELLRGPINSTVRVIVRRAGTTHPLPIVITRDEIQMPLVKEAKLESGYGYIRLLAYGKTTVSGIIAAVQKMKAENKGPLKGLLIDEKNNIGGDLEVVHALLNTFLAASHYKDNESAVTISEEHRGKIQATHSVRDPEIPGVDILNGAPLVVEVNAGSASAAEIFAGVCQIHGRCTVVGTEPSFGKGTVQVMFPLQSGKVKITVAQYLIGPRGCEKPVQNIGIIPDILLKLDEKKKPETPPWHEKDYPNALLTSTPSTAHCKYHFSVPAEHQKAAREMLKVFGLEPKDPT